MIPTGENRIGGMIPTGENRITGRKICPNLTLFATNPTQTGLGSKPSLRSDRPATERLSHGMAYIPVRDKGLFQLLIVQTASGAHPAS